MVTIANPELLNWLLGQDNPSARYLALHCLLGRPQEAPDVIAARSALMRSAPIQAILDAQYPAGYWIKPDRGYSPKYKATIWQLIFMADLGATRNECIARACEHVIGHALRTDYGLFSAHKHSSGIFPCLNGDLLRTLWHFGYGEHPIVHTVVESLAQRVIVDGFICVRNGTRMKDKTTWLSCIWGCVKVLRGFAAIPSAQRPPAVRQAIERGVAFLLSHNLTQDQRPTLVATPSHWLHLGFPLGYGSDLLEALLALAELGMTAHLKSAACPSSPRAAPPSRHHGRSLSSVILRKRDEMGRWPLEHALRNTWADFGSEGTPSKWVTLRALAVLDAILCS